MFIQRIDGTKNGVRTPRCGGMRDQVLESIAGSLLGSEGGCRWTARACHTSAALLGLAAPGIPGPCAGLCARAQVCSATHTHERTQATEHFHLHARTQFQAPSSHKEHRGSSAPRSGIAAACAHADSIQRQLKAGAPAVLHVQAQEKGWRNIQEQREGKSSPPCSPRARFAALLTPATVRAQMGARAPCGAAAHDQLQASRPVTKRKRQVTEYETDTDAALLALPDHEHTRVRNAHVHGQYAQAQPPLHLMGPLERARAARGQAGHGSWHLASSWPLGQ